MRRFHQWVLLCGILGWSTVTLAQDVAPLLPEEPSAPATATPAPDVTAPTTAPTRALQASPAELPEREPPPPRREETAPTDELAVSRMPGALVSAGQCGAFLGTEWALVLLGYGCLMLPIPLTGPTACALGVLLGPGAAAFTATALGDYLSGERHPLLWATLVSYASIWTVLAVGVAAELALGVAVSLVSRSTLTAAYNKVSDHTDGQSLPDETDLRGIQDTLTRGAIPILGLLAGMAAVGAVAMVALSVVPPLATTATLWALRRPHKPAREWPRMVDAAPPSPPDTARLVADHGSGPGEPR